MANTGLIWMISFGLGALQVLLTNIISIGVWTVARIYILIRFMLLNRQKRH